MATRWLLRWFSYFCHACNVKLKSDSYLLYSVLKQRTAPFKFCQLSYETFSLRAAMYEWMSDVNPEYIFFISSSFGRSSLSLSRCKLNLDFFAKLISCENSKSCSLITPFASLDPSSSFALFYGNTGYRVLIPGMQN